MSRAAPKKEELDKPDDKPEIDLTLKEITKRYGGGVITQASKIYQPERISTDIFTLDFALLGGVPIHRFTQLEGQKSSGKSTLASRIMASAQRQYPDQQVVLLDIEGSAESAWLTKNGVDTEKLLVVRPETGEAALDIADAMLRTREVSLLVVDSLAALSPMKEQENSLEDVTVGAQARLVGMFIRKAVAGLIAEKIRGHAIGVITIVQYRSRIGGWSPTGDPTTTSGGKAAGFANGVEIAIKNKEVMGKDSRALDAVTHNEHAFTIKKNKLNGGLRTGEYRLVRASGDASGLPEGAVDDAGTMLAFAKKFGVYTGAGSGWTLKFNDYEKKFTSVEKAVEHLYAAPDEKALLRKYLIGEQARHLGMPDEFIKRIA